MRSNTLNKVFALGFSCNPEGSGSGSAGGGFLPTPNYQTPEGSGSGSAGGGFLPPAL